ncbi:PEP/pyruvate-binding domain-containing protein [Nonomuraea sp. NPDC059194]|uniref:PEP/pyruvate-binding domain-containing protein n=1 Tax=Nonomuraea sp. NPDC059194 TaxID=3346764 RepID=UPI0036CC20A1
MTTAREPLALPFAVIDAGMLADVGGKAANLGELTAAGLPVPPGCCLTTEAYHRVAEGTALKDVIAELATTDATDTAALAGLAGRARALLLDAPVPDEVRAAVDESYARLGDRAPVAVRSSATAEDLPYASFAGQQDTYLNVVGPEAVRDAVRRCWASLWTDRAVAYRASNGIDHAAVRLAVVLQRMVDAEVAGVMFTANPVTGRRHEAVIDAAPGLGEAVVSGAVNPDRFVVDAATGQITERRIGDKRVSIRPLPGGGTERTEHTGRTEGTGGTERAGHTEGTGNTEGTAGIKSTERTEPTEPTERTERSEMRDAQQAQQACLTDDQVRDLAALGRRVEEHYGSPQDTEWAIDADDVLWLTQARPITTLYPLPETNETARDGLRVYFSVNVAQGVMRPFTPMGLAAFKVISGGAAAMAGHPPTDPLAGAGIVVQAGQRLFLDITAAVRSKAGRLILPRALAFGEARAGVVFEQVAEDPRLSLTTTSLRPFLRTAARVARRVGAPKRVALALARPQAALDYTRRLGKAIEARLRIDQGASAEQRLDHAERCLRGTFPTIFSIMPIAVVGYAGFGLAGRLSGAKGEQLQAVLRSLPNNPTTEMDLELWRLATEIGADPEAAEPFRTQRVGELAARYARGELKAQRAIDRFLARYGHRGVAEIDLGMPRWSDEPAHILGVLANYLRLDGDDLTPDEMFARGAQEAERAVRTIVAMAAARGRWRGRLAAFGLRRTRLFGGLRELPKYYMVEVLAAVRRSMRVVGEELVAKGVLDTADDVYFLDFRETRAALGGGYLGALVAERRAAYEQEVRRRHVPRVLLSDGTEPEALAVRAAAEEGALTGTPASAGTVTGPARVVLDPVGAHLEPGEILVAPSTDPGWTPLFLTAGGLVMEMGGSMSHGAVVAREYGIPAVVGVADATHEIVTGQTITVDGSAGVISIAEWRSGAE